MTSIINVETKAIELLNDNFNFNILRICIIINITLTEYYIVKNIFRQVMTQPFLIIFWSYCDTNKVW